VWLAYLLLVVAGTARIIRRRRAVTVLYHIDGKSAHAAIEAAVVRCGWSWARQNNVYVIEGKSAAALEVTVAPTLRTVALRWLSGGEAFNEPFAATLTEVLDDYASGENPVVGWLLTVAIVLFALMVFCVILFVVFMMTLPR